MVTANFGAGPIPSKYRVTIADTDINTTTNTFYSLKQLMYFYGKGSDISLYFSKITPSCAPFCLSMNAALVTATRYSRAGEEEQNVQCEMRKEWCLHGHVYSLIKRWQVGNY